MKAWVLFFNAPNRGNDRDDRQHVNRWIVGRFGGWHDDSTLDGHVFSDDYPVQSFASLDDAITRLRELVSGGEPKP